MYKIIALIALVLLSACKTQDEQETIRDIRPAIFKLVREKSSCTAFHVGDGVYVTAKHCVDEQSMDDYQLIDSKEGKHAAYVISVSEDSDVALLLSDSAPSKIELWDTKEPVEIGIPLLGLGYPGYFYSEFMFETGFLNSITVLDGNEVYFSKNLVYMGESGGPIVNAKTGKLVGISSSFLERVKFFDEGPMHQHITLSMIIPCKKVAQLIATTKIK